MEEVTRVLSAIELGDSRAADHLLPLVYDELRRLAEQRLAREQPGQTLQPTALVHEAYLRLVGGHAAATSWSGRGHFFAAAAEAMRRILVERARRNRTLKRGGDLRRINAAPDELAAPMPDEQLLAIDEALDRFEREFSDKAAVVKLRFFAGLTNVEAAAALGISAATAHRYWVFARAWLFNELSGECREN
jgi:RNA polymerase sigma factor (TIGR02999 family)